MLSGTEIQTRALPHPIFQLIRYITQRHKKMLVGIHYRILFVFFMVAAVGLLRIWTGAVLRLEISYAIALLAILWSTIVGGFVAGVASTILIVGDLFLFPVPNESMYLQSVLLTLLGVAGCMTSFLVETIFYITFRSERELNLLRLTEEHFSSLVNGLHDHAVFSLDSGGYIATWNRGAERLGGYTEKEVLGKYLSYFYTDDDNSEAREDLQLALTAGRAEREGWQRRRDGSLYWALLQIISLQEENGKHRGYTCIVKDLTALKQTEAEMHRRSSYDILTGLFNRKSFEEELRATLNRSRQYHESLAVFFLDLDAFKVVNECLGHDIGDKVIREVGRRLTEVNPSGSTTARFGGDEFIVLIPKLRTITAMTAARKMIDAFHPDFIVDGQPLHISASIGVVIYPGDGSDASALLRNADAALHLAKRSGKNTFKMYSQTLHRQASHRFRLEGRLRRALTHHDFRVYYQPIIDAKTGKLVGAEALARWDDAQFGSVSPAEFIPLAEETGMIVPIGESILDLVCCDLEKWKEDGFLHRTNFWVSVNLSARQFAHKDIAHQIQTIIASHLVPPRAIQFEITETVAMQDIDSTVSKLESLAQAGYESVLDDFGIGFSSLSYLRHLPIGKMKIDQSFVRRCSEDGRDLAVIKAVISLAHAFKIKVVAEGVETAAQLKIVTNLGCDQLQGFYISRPVPAEEMVAWLQREMPRGEKAENTVVEQVFHAAV
jgi:diguanylate cyclase (GGDEF)-like protein/PAS domain S-box-containing protein